MTTLIKIKSFATRSDATLVQDTLGMLALVVMLVVALHLPVLV